MRSSRVFLLTACVVFAACADKDDDLDRELLVNGLRLTTAEDTPISGSILAVGQVGRLRVSVEQGPSHGTLTLTKTKVTYTPEANYAGADSAVLSVGDDHETITTTVAVTITPVNDAPVASGPVTFTIDEDTSITLTAATLGVTDIDDVPSTLSIMIPSSAAYTVDNDELIPAPNFFGTLALSIVVSDGTDQVTTAVTVDVTPVNDAPNVSVPAPQVTAEDVPFTFTGDAIVSVSDGDAASSPIAVELSASTGTVTLATTSGLTFTTGDGTADPMLRFSGTTSAINAALAGMTLTPPPDFNGLIDLTLTANDQGAIGAGGAMSDSESFTLGVSAVDTPPFNHVPDTHAVNEDETLAFTASETIAIADRDGPDTTAVTLQVTNGTLTLGTTTGLTFSSGDGTTDAAMDFGGSLANINAALATLTFRPSQNYNGDATLTVTSTTNSLSDTDACTISVAARNDAPVITGPTTINVDPLGVVTFDGTFLYALADIDAGDALIELAITATTGGFAVTGAPAYAVSFPDAQSILMTGRLADFAADLGMLQWDPQAAALTTPVTLTLTLNDGGASGGGGALMDTHTTTIIDGLPTIAVADAFIAQGNVRRLIAAPGVIGNDSPAGDLTIIDFDAVSSLGGAVSLAADGSFTYDPPLGIGAREPAGVDDTFTYTIANGGGQTAVSTVTIKILRVFWFVDKDGAGPTQDGSQLAPFDTIQEAVAACATSSPGSTIWVRNAATPYDVDITVPADSILRGSRVDFPLQTGQVLVGTGKPVLRNSATTAVRVGANAQVTGFDFVPGTIQTGPAIAVENVANGLIDHVTVDGFATAVRYANNADVPVVNNVEIRNAAARAIQLETNVFTTMAIFDAHFEDVGNGIEVTATPGPTGNGHLLLRVFDVDANRVAGNVLSLQSTSSATAVNQLRVDDFVIQNPLASGVAGTTAIMVNAGGGGLDFEITNTSISGDFFRGVELQAATDPGTIINGRISQLTVNGGGTAMSGGGIVLGGAVAGGSLDVTMDNSTVSGTVAGGMRFTSNGVVACLDLTTSSFGGDDRFELTQSVSPLALEGYTSGAVEDYFAPRGVTEAVSESGVFNGAACREPPTF
ncbi:MAG: tandem-95 repeat protein [Myxococcota bacterium]